MFQPPQGMQGPHPQHGMMGGGPGPGPTGPPNDVPPNQPPGPGSFQQQAGYRPQPMPPQSESHHLCTLVNNLKL